MKNREQHDTDEVRIVVVDEDPLVVKALGSALAQASTYEVETFTSIDALEERASEIRPDAIIAGVRSNGLDGLALVDQAEAADPDLVSLLLTRTTDEAATAQVMAAVGPLRCVHTPGDMADLLPKLQAGLERRQLRRTVSELRSTLATRNEALQESKRQVQHANEQLRSTHTELRTATERLLQSEQLAAVGRVATGIAYELSRQLTLVGYAEAIKSRVAADQELVEFADIIVNAQKRLSAMVDEIRDFAAGDIASSGNLDREPADVAAVVDEALAIMHYDRDVRQRDIQRRYQARPLAALHRDKFSQVVINLVSNAVLATAPGDSVLVDLDIDQNSASTPVAVLTVRDHGVGMPAEVLARLGEPFFTTRGDRGSGLGVGICMRIVEEHGGKLTFASQVGHGTTAHVTIPLIPEGKECPNT